jgi:hypothetical protein
VEEAKETEGVQEGKNNEEGERRKVEGQTRGEV